MSSAESARPRGRAEVRQAVLDATGDLLAERGPAGFTVREVAERAGVNHALVHRHFGTKAEVLQATLAEEARAVVEAVAATDLPTRVPGTPEQVGRLLDLLAQRPSYWRTVVQAVLQAPEAVIPGTASTTELFADLWRGGDSERAAASAVAGLTAVGWLVFGDFLADATGADPAEVRRLVADQVAAVLAADPDPDAEPEP